MISFFLSWDFSQDGFGIDYCSTRQGSILNVPQCTLKSVGRLESQLLVDFLQPTPRPLQNSNSVRGEKWNNLA